jgi:hypothetical protein
VGSVPLGATQLSVGCKQTKDVSTGQKIHGLIVEIDGNQFGSESALVDDDEVTSLLNAVQYLAKVNSTVTALGGFEARYATRGGLRVIAECLSKDGAVINYVQFEGYPRVTLTPVEMTQFQVLLQQGRKSLDALKSGK